MKNKLIIILPILFLVTSMILFQQTRASRNELQSSIDSTNETNYLTFEQLQESVNTELTNHGEAIISFVHFEDTNLATIATDSELFSFPLTVTNSELHEFQLGSVLGSPSNLIIGDRFGLAADNSNNYYYYLLN